MILENSFIPRSYKSAATGQRRHPPLNIVILSKYELIENIQTKFIAFGTTIYSELEDNVVSHFCDWSFSAKYSFLATKRTMRSDLIAKGVTVGEIMEMGSRTFNFADVEGNYFAVEEINS